MKNQKFFYIFYWKNHRKKLWKIVKKNPVIVSPNTPGGWGKW